MDKLQIVAAAGPLQVIWDLDKLDLDQAKSSLTTAVQYARQLIERGDAASLDDAAKIYAAVLAIPSLPAASPYRAEIQSLYGALLCLRAQNEPDSPSAAHWLERAHQLLHAALKVRAPGTMPEAWATTSANLALVYLTRYVRTRNHADLMAAHLALDGTSDVFVRTNDAASAAWVHGLRDYLIELAGRG